MTDPSWATGSANARPCRPASCGDPAPRPRTNRPPDDRVQGGRQHRDRGRAASPDVEHSGAETDPAGPPGDRGEQHGGVVPPPFRQQEGVVAEGLRPFREVHHDVVPGLHGGDTDGQGRRRRGGCRHLVLPSCPPLLSVAPIAVRLQERRLQERRQGGRRGQVRFRILGPLQVEDVDGPVALGGPKPRLLLAVLIVAAGEVVPADRLVAALWRDAVPPGAVTALRAYVSRLRGVLAPAVALRHRPPGYCLILDGATLDAAEFEQLVGAGAGRRRSGGPRPRADRPRRGARAVAGRGPRRVRRRRVRDRHGRAADRAPHRRARRPCADAAGAGSGRRGAARARGTGAPPPVPGTTRGRAHAGAVRDGQAGRRAGRLPRPARPARRRAGRRARRRGAGAVPADPRPRSGAVDGTRRRATCRGGRAVSSAAVRRSSVSVLRSGRGRW